MVAKKRKKEKSNLFSVLFLLLFFLLIAVFLGITNWRLSKKRSELNSRITEIKENIKHSEDKKGILEENLSKAGSQQFIEEKAREDLGFKKPNEDMIVITREEEEKETEEEKEKKEWWEKLKFWDY